jgi:heme-degrading monooxygenase HmoA
MTRVRQGGADATHTARMAGESMLAWLREFEGYEGLTILSEPGTGNVVIVTYWESEEAAARSARGRSQVRDSMVAAAGAEVESVQLLEVVLDDRP